LFLFLAVIPFVSVSSFWECRASGGVLRYLWVGESRHATIQTCVHKPYCTRVPSCTHSYHSLCHSFDIRVLSSRRSFISNTPATHTTNRIEGVRPSTVVDNQAKLIVWRFWNDMDGNDIHTGKEGVEHQENPRNTYLP